MEGSSFEVFSDNQVLKHLFNKPNMNLREARWINLFAQFCITRNNLKPGRVHVLGGDLSGAPHFMEESIILKNLPKYKIETPMRFNRYYEDDEFFGAVICGLRGIEHSEKVQKYLIYRLPPLFSF